MESNQERNHKCGIRIEKLRELVVESEKDNFIERSVKTSRDLPGRWEIDNDAQC